MNTPNDGGSAFPTPVETPRTDGPMRVIIHRIAGSQTEIEVVPAEFSRKLERELSSASAKIASLTDELLLGDKAELEACNEQLRKQLAKVERELEAAQTRFESASRDAVEAHIEIEELKEKQ